MEASAPLVMSASAEAAALRTGVEAGEPDLHSSRSLSRPPASAKVFLKSSSPLEARLPSMLADKAYVGIARVSK